MNKKYLEFVKYLILRFMELGCNYRAAALTFTSLLALVPLMVVSFIVFAVFPFLDKPSQEIQDFIFKNFVPEAGQAISSYLQMFVSHASRLSLIGVGVLLITAVFLLFSIEQTLNVIWRINKTRKPIKAFFIYSSILIVFPLMLGMSLILSSYSSLLPLVSEAIQYFHLKKIILILSPPCLSFLAFMSLYKIIPYCPVSLKAASVGGLTSSLLFEVAKAGFGLYVTYFPTYKLLYGALAIIPLFLIWVYLSWMIVLMGAIITNAVSVGYPCQHPIALDGFSHALNWLTELWKPSYRTRGLSLAELIRNDVFCYEVSPEQQINYMLKANLIKSGKHGRYLLAKNLHYLKLKDVYYLLPWKYPSVNQINHIKASWQPQLLLIVKCLETSMNNQAKLSVAALLKN